MNIKEHAVQDALGTLRIFEIMGYKDTSTPFNERYSFERWVKVPTAAIALIFALQEDPTLADFTLKATERVQEDADDWEDLGPFGAGYYMDEPHTQYRRDC